MLTLGCACSTPLQSHLNLFVQRAAVASALEKLVGAPALLVPFGQASDGCHLPNERLRRANLLAGKNVVKNLLQELAGACPATAGQQR